MTSPDAVSGMPSPLIQYPRVHFETGALRLLPGELTLLGVARPLVVTDPGLVRCGALERVRAAMRGAALEVFDEIPENPTIECVERTLATYRAAGCDGLVALGGGSVMDAAKAVAVLATHPGPIHDYFGRPERIGPSIAKLIAVPTTAGSGSEVSRGAGIHPTADAPGEGMTGPWLVPKTAICDPELTLTLPRFLTAATGLDALSHAVEGFLAKANNPVGDALAIDALRRVLAWLPRAVENGSDLEARWHMMLAAMQAMLHAKGLGSAHAIGNTLGDQGMHHGVLVALALPTVLRSLEPRMSARMAQLAMAMGLGEGQRPADAIEAFNARLGMPKNLKEYGYRLPDPGRAAALAHDSFFNRPAPYHPTLAEYRLMIEAIDG